MQPSNPYLSKVYHGLNFFPGSAGVISMSMSFFTLSELQLAVAATKFVWIDVACIDQAPNSKEYYTEIGRQARIFRSAQDVFAWFTTFDKFNMATWHSDMIHLSAKGTGGYGEEFHSDESFQKWIKKALEVVKSFTSDPWFSSLWTLQEAFLCPYAVILHKHGIANETARWIEGRGKDVEGRPGHLKELIDTCHQLKANIERLKNTKTRDQDLQLVYALELEMEKFGFLEGFCEENHWDFALDLPGLPLDVMGNPFALLKASNRRNAFLPVDKVYGIMQVFELQLGKSAPGCENREYTVEELEDQLGEALLKKYPVSSQLIVQDAGCPSGKAWRINPDSSLPHEAHEFWRHVANCRNVSTEQSVDIEGRGALLRTEKHGEVLLGCFTGQITSLKLFVTVVEPVLDWGAISCNLDKKWLFELRRNTDSSMPRPHEKLDWLLGRFHNPVILLLSRITPPQIPGSERPFVSYVKFRDWGIGLLLVLEESAGNKYTKLGSIIWDFVPLHGNYFSNLYPAPADTIGYLNGTSDGWTKIFDGVFG